MIRSILFCLICLASVTSFAGDLYVSPTGSDTNPGTSTLPFRTIKKASNAARAGDTVHVAPGTYTGGFTTTPNGTSSSRIRYISEQKWKAKIVPPTNSTTSHGWKNSGDYVDIIGFEIDGTNTQAGIKWRNALVAVGSYNLIKDNHIHHIGLENKDCISNGGSGINSHNYDYGYHNDIVANIIHHVGPPLCKFYGGIYFSTSGSIKNNLIYETGNWGIQTWHDAGEIDIVNNTIVKSGGGIMVGGGGYYHLPGPADYINVSNNIVYGNAKGIMNQGEVGTHNTYTNNLSFKNAKYTMSLSSGNVATGTIQADPQFVDYEGGDYRLKSSSPAVDVGLDTYAPKTDIKGVARPQGQRVDLGAFEYVVPAPTPEPSTSTAKIVVTGNPAAEDISVEVLTTATGDVSVSLYDNGVLRKVEYAAPYCFTGQSTTKPTRCLKIQWKPGTHKLEARVIAANGSVLARAYKTIVVGSQ